MTDIVANIVVRDKISDGIDRKLDTIARKSLDAAKSISALNAALRNMRVGNVSKISAELNKLRGLNLGSIKNVNILGNGDVSAFANSLTALGKNATIAGVSQANLSTSVEKVSNSSDKAERSTVRLTKAIQRKVSVVDRSIPLFKQFVATLATHQIFQITETYNRLTNRLTLVTESAEQARGRFSSLSAVAKASYSDISGVVTLYTRLDLAMRQIGGSSQDAVLITQSLSKAMSLAGLSAGEANSAMLQISQAFNKGKLDGDEFRSVMENMPLVMDAIAKKMGVTRGELLELAPKGKITAEIMKEAILDSAEEIDAAFSKITPTVAQMFENLQTSAIEYFGELNKNVGVTNLLGAGFKLLAENIDIVVSGLAVLTVSFGFGAALKSISSAIVLFGQLRTAIVAPQVSMAALGASTTATTSAFNALGLVIKSNPIFTLGTLITAVISGVVLLGEKLGMLEFFGSFDQDMQKANDYVNRIEDIRERKERASKVELIKESDSANASFTTLSNNLTKVKDSYIAAQRESQKWSTLTADGVKAVSDGTQQFLGVFAKTISVQNEATVAASRLTSAQSDLEKAYIDIVSVKESEIDTLKEASERLQDQISATEKQIELTKAANAPIDNLEAKLAELKAEYERITDRINTATGALQAFLSTASLVGNFSVGTLVSNARADKQYQEDKLKTQKVLLEINEANNKQAIASLSHAQRDLEFKKKAADVAKKAADSAKNVNTNDADVKKIEKHTYDKEYQRLVNEYKASQPKPKAGRGGGRSKKEELTEEAKALKEATKSWKEYNENLKSEELLLNQGFEAYTKYKSLYEQVNKAKVAGLEIGKSEIEQAKQLIDLNERRRKVMSYAEDFKQNTYGAKSADFDMRREGLKTANLSEEDQAGATNSLLGNLGLDVTGTSTYYDQLVNDASHAYSQINKLQQDNLIDAQQSFAMRAQVWAKTQEGMVQPVANMLSSVAQLQNSENKRIARIGKAAAVAQAIMNTYTGATAAYASAAAIPYVGWIMAPIAAGLAVVAGMANVANIRSQGTGYFSGGFTGRGNPTDFAGWTHKNEFVFDHKSTSDLGVDNLQALRTGAAEIRYKGENATSSNGGGVSVSIENYGSDKNFDVQQIDENSIRIVVTDVLQSQGETIVRNYLNTEDGQNRVARIAKQNS